MERGPELKRKNFVACGQMKTERGGLIQLLQGEDGQVLSTQGYDFPDGQPVVGIIYKLPIGIDSTEIRFFPHEEQS